MKISDSYNELNRVADGYLYQQLQAVAAQPLPPNYELFKTSQRERIGKARVAEQFEWSPAKAQRKVKEGSQLGATIMKHLESVDAKDAPQIAKGIADRIVESLGEIVTRLMIEQEKTLRQPQPVGISF